MQRANPRRPDTDGRPVAIRPADPSNRADNGRLHESDTGRSRKASRIQEQLLIAFNGTDDERLVELLTSPFFDADQSEFDGEREDELSEAPDDHYHRCPMCGRLSVSNTYVCPEHHEAYLRQKHAEWDSPGTASDSEDAVEDPGINIEDPVGEPLRSRAGSTDVCWGTDEAWFLGGFWSLGIRVLEDPRR
jgi:hypothetical protein